MMSLALLLGGAVGACVFWGVVPLAHGWAALTSRQRLFAGPAVLVGLAALSRPVAVVAALAAAAAILIRRQRDVRRRRRCFAELPEFFELLGLCLSSGPSLMSAWTSTVRTTPPGPLQEELEHATRALELGRSASAAMGDLASRLGDSRAAMALALVAQALARGNPLEPVLLSQASALRRLRGMEIERRAQTAPLRMMLPVIGLIFPAVLLLLLAPVLLTLMQGGRLF